jgi:hypothetical protein
MSVSFDTILRHKTMPATAFEGGCGDLVIVQEYTRLDRETYVRVLIPMKDAVSLAEEILAIASHASEAR